MRRSCASAISTGTANLNSKRTADVDRDQEQRRDHGDDRGPGDLLPEGRPDGGGREVVALDAEVRVERLLDLVHLGGLELRNRDLDHVVAELRVVDLLDLRVGVAQRIERVPDVLDARGPLERRGDPRARLEVDAEVDPERGDRDRAHGEDHAGEREEPARLAHEVEAPAARCAPCPRRARSAGAGSRLRAIVPRIAEVASTAVNSETMVPIPSVNAKPLMPGGGEREQDERHADRHDVGVDDRAQRLRVAGGDGGRDRSARAHLLLDSLEHDDVRVGGHRQREHHSGDARQRERDRDQLDQREQQHRVDQQRARWPRGRARGRRGGGRGS